MGGWKIRGGDGKVGNIRMRSTDNEYTFYGKDQLTSLILYHTQSVLRNSWSIMGVTAANLVKDLSASAGARLNTEGKPPSCLCTMYPNVYFSAHWKMCLKALIPINILHYVDKNCNSQWRWIIDTKAPRPSMCVFGATSGTGMLLNAITTVVL